MISTVTQEQYIRTLLRLKMSAGIGDTSSKMILSVIKDHPDVLDYDMSELKKIFHSAPQKLIKDILKSQHLGKSDDISREMDLIGQHRINVVSIIDDDYPGILKDISDAPSILFYQGSTPLQHPRNISIIGTRKNSDWTKIFTEQLIADLSAHHPQIVSGLAIGIDTIAHKSALINDIPTIAVLANGLLNIYPTTNRPLAKNILDNGGTLISEHLPRTFADKQNFPLRNRIVAGLSPLTLLIESPIKGGSMITGKLAASYNREVAAVAGRPSDEKSKGCHYLIQSQIAHLVTQASDIARVMDWDDHAPKKKILQAQLYSDLSPEELEIINYMKDSIHDHVHIDELIFRLNKSNTTISSILLSLELSGHIISLSGKRYRLS